MSSHILYFVFLLLLVALVSSIFYLVLLGFVSRLVIIISLFIFGARFVRAVFSLDCVECVRELILGNNKKC